MTYILTALDLAALRKADYLSVSLKGEVQTVRATKENRPTETNPFATDIDHLIAAPVTMRSATYGQASDARCFANMRFWRGQDSHIGAVVSMLRVGDEIAFEFCPDHHTNQYMERADLHGDILRLVVTRGKRRHYFEVDHSNCPDNTARMCYGARSPYKAVA